MKNMMEYSWWEKHSRKFEFAALAFLLLVMILYIVDDCILKSHPSRTLPLRIIFIALEAAFAIPGILLLFSKEGRKIHVAKRIREAFKWIWDGWAALLAFWLGYNFYEGPSGWPQVVVWMGTLGVLIKVVQWILQKKIGSDPESMFL
ncbi:MAG: hypothetical protein R6U57_13045 [Anaerolineales bacterium]